MAPAVIMALASAVQAVAPLIKSGIQKNRLKKLGDVERPDFEIPEAAKEQLGIARSIAGNRNMPGYNEALDKIENQTNRAIGDVKAAGGNMQDIMAAMASANVGAAMAKRDLDITNDRSYLGSLQNLQTQLGQYATQENLKQQDEMKAYNDEMARRAALETASQQNKQAGIGAISQGIAQYGGYQMNMDMLNKIYPTTTPPVVPPVQEPPMEKMLGIDAKPIPMPPNTGVNIAPQLNAPIVSAQNPSGAQVMTPNPFQGTEVVGTPMSVPNTLLNPITASAGPVMTSPNPMTGNEVNFTPTSDQEKVIAYLRSIGLIK